MTASLDRESRLHPQGLGLLTPLHRALVDNGVDPGAFRELALYVRHNWHRPQEAR